MKTFTLTEAKKQLGAVLEKARAGEAIEVTRYGKPVFQFQRGETVIAQRRVSSKRVRRTFGRLLVSMRRRQPEGGRSVTAMLADVRSSRASAHGIG